MRTFYFLSVSFLCFQSAGLFSQEPTGVKISIFKPDDITKADSIKNAPADKNIIKWNWSLMTRGVFVINYEFFLNAKFTCEPGLGITYRDWIYENIKNEYFVELRNPKPKLCGEVALKFYPTNHYDFEGFYISPGISYRKYSYDNQKEIYGNYAGYDPNFMLGYDFFDMQLKFGIQYENIFIDELYSDFYFGFAYRNVKANYYERFDAVPYGSYYKTATKAEAYPTPLFGFKAGITF